MVLSNCREEPGFGMWHHISYLTHNDNHSIHSGSYSIDTCNNMHNMFRCSHRGRWHKLQTLKRINLSKRCDKSNRSHQINTTIICVYYRPNRPNVTSDNFGFFRCSLNSFTLIYNLTFCNNYVNHKHIFPGVCGASSSTPVKNSRPEIPKTVRHFLF